MTSLKSDERFQISSQAQQTILTETQDTSLRRFNNEAGSTHINGLYRWVDKIYTARPMNYGRRLLLSFNVPEPAAFYRAMLAQNQAQLLADLVEPVHPRSGYCPLSRSRDHSPGHARHLEHRLRRSRRQPAVELAGAAGQRRGGRVVRARARVVTGHLSVLSVLLGGCRALEGDRPGVRRGSDLRAVSTRGKRGGVVPARPGCERAMVLFLKTGLIWGGGYLPLFTSQDMLDVYADVELGVQIDPPEQIGDSWEVRVPTSLIMLQETSELPEFPVEGEEDALSAGRAGPQLLVDDSVPF